PGEDADAAHVIENAFKRNGMRVLSKSRADSVERTADGVLVTLSDGRKVEGSHCLMAVGSVPNTAGIGLEEAGVQLSESGHIRVNRVARTSMPNIYAAGDCTTFVPLASVASMQGRTAVFHAMGDIVNPRAKMMGIRDGFVKLFAASGSGGIIGGVIVAPKASELIFPLALAIEHRL